MRLKTVQTLTVLTSPSRAMSPFVIRLSGQATIVFPLATGVPFSPSPTLLADQVMELVLEAWEKMALVVKWTIYIFTGTTNGARIKTWQGGSGYARNITFERIKLDRAQYPIIIDQYYCNGEHDCKSQSSAVVVADVMYIDFEGTSATEEAIKLDCDQVSGGCHNIVMDRINIMPAVRDMKIFATCKNAKGTYVGTTVPNVPCLQSSATEPTRPTTIYTGSGGSGSANLHINYYLSLFIGIARSQKIFDITKYGAVGDGRTDDSPAFLKSWGDICNGENDGVLTLLVPEGKTSMRAKKSTLHIEVLGNVLAPNRGAWKECESGSWLSFSNIENLMVDGFGKIDGQGSAGDNDNCKPQKALEFNNCLNLSGLPFLNSPQAHIGINGCDNADVLHLNVHAPENSPNTDSIDISFLSHISIRDSFIRTSDDCIAINGGCSFLYITSICMRTSVGSLGADGATEKVDNIYVKDCSFTRTINGARIKTWQGDSGYARNITFERIKLDGAQNPIVIDQYYCNEDQNCKSQPSAWGDATYINFEGTPATEGDSVRLR
ncbi:hypothetical protein DVH24_002860 [Malus domestica]|uniref:Polygalacturonase n=1 Tax=Malus domestica TaxID=3750 RepID=A0A498KBD3_MALDO|nr:hypothetical protein DVH24_002860 [Malus domestica]